MNTEYFHSLAIVVFALIAAVAIKTIGLRAKKQGDSARQAMGRLQFKIGLMTVGILIPLFVAQRFSDDLYGTPLQALSSAFLGIVVALIGSMLVSVAAYFPLATARWIDKAPKRTLPGAVPMLILGILFTLVAGVLKNNGLVFADAVGFTGVIFSVYGGLGLMTAKNMDNALNEAEGLIKRNAR